MDDEGIALVALAEKRFPDLTEPERGLMEAVAQGGVLDLRDLDEHKKDLDRADYWDESRVLRADVIAWLCKTPKAREYVTDSGIYVEGARIDGMLDLGFAGFDRLSWFSGNWTMGVSRLALFCALRA